MDGYEAFYRGRPVMVTGGLGFIGSTLARRLVDLGADVLVVDALIPDLGGNRFNLAGVEDRLRVRIADLRDAGAMEDLAGGVEVIFNLAGQASHIDSMRDPQADLELNARAHLELLEACRRRNPRARVVYASTRQIYGRPERLPIDESHPVRPVDVNGVHKAAAEGYHLVYHRAYGLPTCALRLTNVYGPRQLVRHSRQGFIGWFIRLAVEGREIQIYGDGSQLRDFVYVDDAADAFLRAGASEACLGGAFNVGGDEPIAHRDLVALLVDVAGAGSVRFVDWPAEKQAIDIGSVWLDSARFRAATGWRPRVGLREGLAQAVAYYRQHLDRYVDTPAPVRP
ncbi:MAG TPA: NAD-dependent epimerase/dehydratase family protein [Vicinamibacterales bacterium]|nr:NAD-dependent epimerase/dehydratase family protein [Vicinamibacterales bacterium]